MKTLILTSKLLELFLSIKVRLDKVSYKYSRILQGSNFFFESK